MERSCRSRFATPVAFDAPFGTVTTRAAIWPVASTAAASPLPSTNETTLTSCARDRRAMSSCMRRRPPVFGGDVRYGVTTSTFIWSLEHRPVIELVTGFAVPLADRARGDAAHDLEGTYVFRHDGARPNDGPTADRDAG